MYFGETQKSIDMLKAQKINVDMLKAQKINIGLIIATIYLFIYIVAIIELNVSRPDALSGLGLLFLTAPWSFILLDIINKYEVFAFASAFSSASALSHITFYVLITFCAFINASILFFLGNLLTKILSCFHIEER